MWLEVVGAVALDGFQMIFHILSCFLFIDNPISTM